MFSLATMAYHSLSEVEKEHYRDKVPAAVHREQRWLSTCCMILLCATLGPPTGSKWFRSQLTARDRRNMRSIAVTSGHVACARAYQSYGEGLTNDDAELCTSAARRGHEDMLQYLHETGFPWDAETAMSAARAGSVPCLQYLHEKRCPWDARTCLEAAGLASPACLRFVRERGCPWTEEVTCVAAIKDSLPCLTWAREHGCEWHPLTCAAAAVAGNLPCLTYAAENGAPMSRFVAKAADRTGQRECHAYATRWCDESHPNTEQVSDENWPEFMDQLDVFLREYTSNLSHTFRLGQKS